MSGQQPLIHQRAQGLESQGPSSATRQLWDSQSLTAPALEQA